MMGDHRANELFVLNCRLLADEHKEDDQPDHTACNDGRIEALIPIHGSHQQQLKDDHRGGHRGCHIDLVDIVEYIVPGVYHRIHQDVHRDKRKHTHDKQAGVHIMVLMHREFLLSTSERSSPQVD